MSSSKSIGGSFAGGFDVFDGFIQKLSICILLS
nr:MAG TPA: hypothetical protein [Bacteriophage sp.]